MLFTIFIDLFALIIGTGCDIVSISRISSIIYGDFCNDFLQKIFSEDERKILYVTLRTRYNISPESSLLSLPTISKCTSSSTILRWFASHIAKRFAAKEAFAKAFGTGICEKCRWHDIEIEREDGKAPKISERTIKKFDIRAHLSMSDEKEYAIAYVILSN